MQKMRKRPGISGYKTIHSLRATTATRLFHEGVDEQLIMERTGHYSVDGVRSYKQTTRETSHGISDILNIASKKIKNSSTSCLFEQSRLSKDTCSFQLYKSDHQRIYNHNYSY